MNAPLSRAAERQAFRELSGAEQIKALRGQKFERLFQVERSGIDQEARTAWLSIASDRPYERWWGVEILDHSKGSIRDERLRSGAALLVGHDPADQVGVVEKFEITSGRKLRILARFGRSARAEEIWKDVLDGIRRNASVGYIIHDLVLEKQEDNVNTYRVTDWEPLEGSLVSVPADPSVGVGRNLQGKQRMEHDEIEAGSEQGHLPRSQRRREEREGRTEAERVGDLYKAGEAYANLGGLDVARALIAIPGATVEMFKQRMLDKMSSVSKPVNTAEPGDPGPAFGSGARHILAKSKIFQGERGQEEAYRVGQWLRGQLFGHEEAQAWCKERGMEIRAMSTAVNTQGGYLVPDEMASTLIDLADKYGAYRQNSTVWPMKGDSLVVPRSVTDPTANFVAENGEIPASDPSYGAVTLNAKKIATLVKASTELIEDSPISVADDVTMKIARSFAQKEDQCGFNGDGTFDYGGMSGVFKMLVDGTHNASAIDAVSGHDTFAEIDAIDLTTLVAALPEYALEGAKWYVSGKGYALVFMRLMLAAGGNSASDIAGTMQRSYGGFPIVTSPVLPSVTTALNNLTMLAFGNLAKASKMGLRRDIRVMILNERYAEYDQVGIQATERFSIVNHDLGSNTVAGPIVGLIGNT